MDKIINEKNQINNKDNLINIVENSPNYSDKKEFKSNASENLYSILLDSLSNDRSDTEKIKAMIILERDITLIKDKNKLFSLIRVLENYLNDTDSSNSNMLKGQSLMTITATFILINAKEEHSQIFFNFLDNILIENIKNTNNYSNIYLRQVSCQCLEELENEYPGLLFSLMGKKTIALLNLNSNKDLSDDKSVFTNKCTSKNVSNFSSKSEIPSIDNRKVELENFGLYNLIEDEVFFVFQNYSSLYTVILEHLINYYFFEHFIKENYKGELQNESNELLPLLSTSDLNEANGFSMIEEDFELQSIKKKGIKKDKYNSFSIKLINFLNSFSYFKTFQNFGNYKDSSKSRGKSDTDSVKDSFQNFNLLFFKSKNNGDKILHVRESPISFKFTSIFDKM